MAHPRPGFVEVELQPLAEPVQCNGCGASLTEVRVMERRGRKETVRLYDCPICGDNLWGGRGPAADSPRRPPVE
jgi:hypothetical protein